MLTKENRRFFRTMFAYSSLITLKFVELFRFYIEVSPVIYFEIKRNFLSLIIDCNHRNNEEDSKSNSIVLSSMSNDRDVKDLKLEFEKIVRSRRFSFQFVDLESMLEINSFAFQFENIFLIDKTHKYDDYSHRFDNDHRNDIWTIPKRKTIDSTMKKKLLDELWLLLRFVWKTFCTMNKRSHQNTSKEPKLHRFDIRSTFFSVVFRSLLQTFSSENEDQSTS